MCHLTILRRFSWPNLICMCTYVHKDGLKPDSFHFFFVCAQKWPKARFISFSFPDDADQGWVCDLGSSEPWFRHPIACHGIPCPAHQASLKITRGSPCHPLEPYYWKLFVITTTKPNTVRIFPPNFYGMLVHRLQG